MKAESILIVEDEAIVALDLQLQLQDLGYIVVGIESSGDAAIAAAAASQPSLVLMDVRLHGAMDGIEAASAIRRKHDIPVIYLTSHSDSETVRRAASTAPYGYLTKPYQIKELRAGIEVALTKARIERQLRDSDRWFARTLQCVSDGVILTDEGGRVRFVNPAAEELTGWSIEAAMACELSEVVHFAPGGPEGGVRAVLHEALHDGRATPVQHAVAMTAKNGTARVVDTTAAPVDDDQGKRLGAVLVLRDAAERVAQEVRLRESEAQFRLAFGAAPLGMALVSFNGVIIQANEALHRLLQAPPSVLRGANHTLLTPEADRAHEALRLQELGLAPGHVVQFEKRYQRPLDGTLVWTLVSVSLLHQHERPTCYLYQVHDLSEQKVAAERLAELAEERMRREASDLANLAKTDFLARVSHEMRTPLNAVIGFSQLMQMDEQMAPTTTHAYAGQIRNAGEHLLALVNDLLDLSSAAQGKLKLTLQPLPLSELVSQALPLLEVEAASHGIALAAEVDPAWRVMADPRRLRQVLLNLLSNAIKYNREGGYVRVHVSRAESGRVRLQVEDGGIGMTPDQLARMFQPFERLGAERTTVQGTGLGLVIARSLVIEMGGSLAVRSTPRQGTTVTLELVAA